MLYFSRYHSLSYSIFGIFFIALFPVIFSEIYFVFLDSAIKVSKKPYDLFYASATLALEIGTFYSAFRYFIVRTKAINKAQLDLIEYSNADKILVTHTATLKKNDEAFDVALDIFDRNTYFIAGFCLVGFVLKDGFQIVKVFVSQLPS